MCIGDNLKMSNNIFGKAVENPVNDMKYEGENPWTSPKLYASHCGILLFYFMCMFQ